MMIVIDDKRPKDHPSDPLKDPWADWKPRWTPGRKPQTPHDLQEKHSPTETAAVRLTAERRAQKSQRRIVDARLWDGMSPGQQDAAMEIAAAHDMMGRGLGYVMSNWERIPGCRGAEHVADMHARLINTYVDWTKRCARAKVSHSMIIDILCFGFTCRMLDRDRRLRTGHARQNLMDGLNLYCELRGWPL